VHKVIEELRPELERFFTYDNLIIKPSKVAYYEKGGFFKKHVDTVRESTHIGTLLIGTQSPYEGGRLNIGGAKITISNRVHVAFTTDCYHEVERVTEGNRVVLQCDIFKSENCASVEPRGAIHHGVSLFKDIAADYADWKSRWSENTDDHDDTDELFDELLPPLNNHSVETGPSDQICAKGQELAAYAQEFLAELARCQQPSLGIFAEHLYPVGFCTVLRGIDKLIANSILSADPQMRCFCIPTIIRVRTDEDSPDRDVCIEQKFKDFLKDSPIQIHNPCAYNFVASHCDYFTLTGNSAPEGDGEFMYSAMAMFFGPLTGDFFKSYEYKLTSA
jgi:hypothetical protein